MEVFLSRLAASLYLLAISQWMKILKSHTNFSSAHGIVVLGIVACILFFDMCDPGHLGISSKEKGEILRITAGS